jgi:hypothetical protein
MRKYFDRVGKKVNGMREKMSDYWQRMMNHSKERKMSEGAQQVERLITSAHKDQWRRNKKK